MTTTTPGLRRWPARAATVALATVLCALPWTTPAQAHGTVIEPASRNYACWLRWNGDWADPDLPAEDPMCWQAWQDDPGSLLQWDGVSRTGVDLGDGTLVPDGQLCSAGGAAGGRYDSLDEPGDWPATVITNPWDSFTFQLHDTVRHGADFIWVWVSEPGYDPLTEPLTWDDLDLVHTSGSYQPGWGFPSDEPHLPGGTYETYLSAGEGGERTGRAVVFAVWALLGQDEAHYLCSDVTFT
ncbi:lytic polysaccharide monooxygenase auxiliary activity family 9 protein [Streptomyces sp. SBT349]|uniref:lytic polysaccharide monooxygenase auxiliary activity family 9 protein n=1 Tax=Streptomyces sp. SBT349 TaxID=1580539 RepID=UPI00066D2FF6|nr:lytic polysaccharide monooxygenase auxiliary activity family 9 protein [Streptomyces sp. SBT349]